MPKGAQSILHTIRHGIYAKYAFLNCTWEFFFLSKTSSYYRDNYNKKKTVTMDSEENYTW